MLPVIFMRCNDDCSCKMVVDSHKIVASGAILGLSFFIVFLWGLTVFLGVES